MSSETLQTISQLAVLGGIVLTAFGGYGAYHFGKVADKERDRQVQVQEKSLNEKIDSLVQGNEALQKQLAPFERLASTKYPDLKTEAALERLSGEIGKIKDATDSIGKKVEPRRITGKRRDVAVNVLKQISPAPSFKANLTCVLGDSESFQLATDIKDVLTSAGWNVDGVGQAVFQSPPRGIIVEIKDQPAPNEVVALIEALSKAGHETKGFVNSKVAPNSVDLIIGSK